jgi:nickel/cobalt transporter (NiCoT) family protein
MSLVDSADSIIMLYSYSGFPEHSWALIKRIHPEEPTSNPVESVAMGSQISRRGTGIEEEKKSETHESPKIQEGTTRELKVEQDIRVKMNVMSGLSILLTLMSIMVAFRSADEFVQ